MRRLPCREGVSQKALAHGVPVVAVPFGRDQPEVARRVEVAGAGVRLPRGQFGPQRLGGAVRTAIGLRPGAKRIQAAFATAGGAGAAADALESLLAIEPTAEHQAGAHGHVDDPVAIGWNVTDAIDLTELSYAAIVAVRLRRRAPKPAPA